jgi:DnaJ family protein A protein 2
MVKDSTLYERLEIPVDANEGQIKKAFNKLSKQWHPDKHPDEKKEEASKKFQDINQAKEVLLDDNKKKLYDQIGMDMFKNGMDSNQDNNPFSGGFPGFGGFPVNIPGFGGFSGSFQHSFSSNQRQKQADDIINELNVTLEQLYNEETVNFTYKYNAYCGKCDGNGTKDGKETSCAPCGGKGMRVQVIRSGNMIQQSIGECPQCRGKGQFIDENNKCEACSGICSTVKEKTVQIPLKSGLQSGNKIQLSGKGHQLKTIKTDLIVVINITSHKLFKKNNNDLFINIELKLYQALFGFDKIITHLDGRKLHISSSSKTDYNTVRKIKGEGLKSLQNDQKGDLYIKFSISLPNLTGLPIETKAQFKMILQNFEKTENKKEQELQTNNETNLVKTILNDCKIEETEHLLSLFEKLKNDNQKQQNSSDEDNQGHPGCVQQ